MKENMEIPLKDVTLIGKRIYNTETNKYGMITGICLEEIMGRIGYRFEAYYDKMEPNSVVFGGDFYKGKIRFVIINMPVFKELNEKYITEIKKFMGNKFSSESIRYITEEEHKKSCSEQEWRGVVEIMGKSKELDSLAADVIQDNYSMLKYFTLFADGIITENQMLYGLVNVLSSELKVNRDHELKESAKHLRNDMKKLLKETAMEWIDKNPKQYSEILKELGENK